MDADMQKIEALYTAALTAGAVEKGCAYAEANSALAEARSATLTIELRERALDKARMNAESADVFAEELPEDADQAAMLVNALTRQLADARQWRVRALARAEASIAAWAA